jgi:archaellum component FlaC
LTGTRTALFADMNNNELKGRFDGIDERFDRVDARFADVDARFDRVDARFADVDARFDSVDARFNEVDARFDSVDARFKDVDARFDDIRQLILEEGGRTRTHFDAVAEGMRDKVKVIAEGHAALIEHHTVTDSRLQRLESGQDRIEVRILAVESRIGGVEKTQKIVLTEVRGLVTKVDRLSPQRRPARRRP